MSEKTKNLLGNISKEIVRVILSALLAAIGIESSGCIANGDSATAALISENVTK